MAERNDSPTVQALGWAWRRWWFRLGCWTLLACALLAIYAPLLASEAALAWGGEHGLSLPAFADLFNRRSYPQYHDLAFNVLALLLPAFITFWLAARRRLGPGRRLAWCALVLVAAFALAQVPLWPRGAAGHQALWDDRPTTACTSLAADRNGPGLRLFPPVPHRWDATYPGAVLKPPGWVNPATGARCWLGTDTSGHDLVARMLFGARISLTIGFIATGLSLLIGTIIGAISGYGGGWIDLVLQRVVEVMMCFPTFILIITVVAMLSRNVFVIMAVIGLTSWAGTARLVRGEFLAQSVRDYVAASRSLGLSGVRVMARHILPNAMAPLLISATFGVAGAVVSESGLSFVGLGDPNAASWGQVLDQGRENPLYGWLIYAPGLTVFALVMALNAVGEGLRQALDPRRSP